MPDAFLPALCRGDRTAFPSRLDPLSSGDRRAFGRHHSGDGARAEDHLRKRAGSCTAGYQAGSSLANEQGVGRSSAYEMRKDAVLARGHSCNCLAKDSGGARSRPDPHRSGPASRDCGGRRLGPPHHRGSPRAMSVIDGVTAWDPRRAPLPPGERMLALVLTLLTGRPPLYQAVDTFQLTDVVLVRGPDVTVCHREAAAYSATARGPFRIGAGIAEWFTEVTSRSSRSLLHGGGCWHR